MRGAEFNACRVGSLAGVLERAPRNVERVGETARLARALLRRSGVEVTNAFIVQEGCQLTGVVMHGTGSGDVNTMKSGRLADGDGEMYIYRLVEWGGCG